MDQNKLRQIIEQVLTEMELNGNTAVDTAPAACEPAPAANVTGDESKAQATPVIEPDGILDDVADINLREQYLVPNPADKDRYMELKVHSPARLGIWHAGARYKTNTYLRFRADHSAAQDAVFTDVPEEFIQKMNFMEVQSQCTSKDEYITRPDLGRKLSAAATEAIKANCKMNPTVQIVVTDGLSSSAITANVEDVLPAIEQGLKSYGIDYGTTFFVKYGRVGVMDDISEVTGAEVTCILVGERPGLITAESMSAYIVYKATVDMPEARRTVVSNIHSGGSVPVEAGAHIAEIIKIMLEKKASGTDLKL